MLRDRIKGFFFPTFSELSLFMMSLAFVLVLSFNKSLFNKLYEFHVSHLEFGSVIVAILGVAFIAGLILCLYFVLSEWEKTNIEKYAMLVFTILTNAVCGIYASMHIMKESTGAHPMFLIFPIWNIINCVLLFCAFNVRNISDEKASLLEIFFGLIFIFGVFMICHFVFRFYWAINFSICVIFATGFSDTIDAVFHPERKDTAAEDAAMESKLDPADRLDKCFLCGRLIMPDETSHVFLKKLFKRKLTFCEKCHDEIQGKR